MNDTKHTPGPWQVVSLGTTSLISQATDEDGRFAIASVFFQNYHPTGLAAARAEQAANAALIASAPDLLARIARAEERIAKAIKAIDEADAFTTDKKTFEAWECLAEARTVLAEKG